MNFGRLFTLFDFMAAFAFIVFCGIAMYLVFTPKSNWFFESTQLAIAGILMLVCFAYLSYRAVTKEFLGK